ncbi:hypothetical protein [Paraburkholderia sp. J76]|uniref:hypothetical protein n=1 Tax=Paraburkholderia sp. J76 TaxID=2805439 RepID=UPI002ABDDCB0|nr:hypothetical protein [Paraburkholderia sp. J76]
MRVTSKVERLLSVLEIHRLKFRFGSKTVRRRDQRSANSRRRYVNLSNQTNRPIFGQRSLSCIAMTYTYYDRQALSVFLLNFLFFITMRRFWSGLPIRSMIIERIAVYGQQIRVRTLFEHADLRG